jgi:hypothetical protein
MYLVVSLALLLIQTVCSHLVLNHFYYKKFRKEMSEFKEIMKILKKE